MQAKYRPWDSNAESFRGQYFNFNSSPSNNNDDDEEDDDNDKPFDADQVFALLGEFIDGIWIFKVFLSFGWLLPPFIVSLLVATGPKAFLMSLALSIGLSALSLVFRKLLGRAKNVKRKAKRKKKPHIRNSTRQQLKEEEEEEEENKGTKKGKMRYQSWVAGNGVPVNKSDQDASSFGGWEELETQTESDIGYHGRSVRAANGPRRSTVKRKLGMRERKRDIPLLLRLLIAVFPFLGSWTKML